ncbi:hypothetical protein NEIG_01435 [Nematocida sp. ERTm5]|nr:hypothetical protein NEIRO02_1402 [Nematocida sp. AWRm79]KAI5183748.1 hypothetical protein NEIRO03_1322 [Nematocida sp. AWRm78]OAG29150.1 hypothetical protein NEIG_01435 [Nematocida sp. ERTm5]
MGYFDCEYNALGIDKPGVLVTNEESKVLAMLNGPFEPSGSIINLYSGTVRATVLGSTETRTQYAAMQESIEMILSDIIYLRDYPRCVLDIKVYVISSGQNILPAIINAISVLLLNAGIQMKGILLSVSDHVVHATSGYVYADKKYQKVLQIGPQSQDNISELDDLLERMVYSLKEDYKKDWNISIHK